MRSSPRNCARRFAVVIAQLLRPAMSPSRCFVWQHVYSAASKRQAALQAASMFLPQLWVSISSKICIGSLEGYSTLNDREKGFAPESLEVQENSISYNWGSKFNEGIITLVLLQRLGHRARLRYILHQLRIRHVHPLVSHNTPSVRIDHSRCADHLRL